MQYPRKIYCVDNGIAQVVGFTVSKNIGHIYENTVANELFRRYSTIYYWKNQKQNEVDFVIKQGTQVKKLIQVCYNLNTSDTKKREIKSLLKAMDAFKLDQGLIITKDYDAVENLNKKKILFKPLWKWLIEK
jgi:hypothetical protein